MGHTCKKVSHLEKLVTPDRNGSHLAKSVTVSKRCHTFKNGLHMEKGIKPEKSVTSKEIGNTCKNGSHL